MQDYDKIESMDKLLVTYDFNTKNMPQVFPTVSFSQSYQQVQLIIYSNSSFMKTYTLLKSSLISLQITPQKQVVDYEINSWLQTNNKKKPTFMFVKTQKNTAPIQTENRSNLATLRQKRLDLLKRSLKKHIKNIAPMCILNQKYELKTAATPSTLSPSYLQPITHEMHSKSIKNKQLKPSIIQVSQFKVDNKELPQLKTKKRLHQLLRVKIGENLRIGSVQIKSNVILQAKVTQNQYRRMSFVTKRLPKQN